MPNEQEQFLKDLNTDEQNQDPFAHLQDDNGTDIPPVDTNAPATDEDTDLKPRNRRERRLEARLQAERESGIQLAAQLAAERGVKREETKPSDAFAAIDRIYGVDTPESREATDILKAALLDIKESAKLEAQAAYDEKASKDAQAVQEAERMLDSMVEEIEDEFDVDLTSKEGEQARADFFKLLERMSPKDKQGNILYYADHFSVWEDYKARTQKKTDTTAKDMSARSMANGAASTASNLANDTTERYLRENGII